MTPFWTCGFLFNSVRIRKELILEIWPLDRQHWHVQSLLARQSRLLVLKVWCQLPVSALAGNFLEMQIVGFHPRPSESDAGGGVQLSVF